MLTILHVPKREVRQKRSLINYRDDVVKRITKIKNSIRAILGREDIHLPSGKKGWTIKALKSIRAMSIPVKEIDDLKELWKGHLNSELNQLDEITEELKAVESKLNALGEADEKIKLLGKTREEIFLILGRPNDVSSGIIRYKYQEGNKQGQVEFECYEHNDYDCTEIRVYWFYHSYNIT